MPPSTKVQVLEFALSVPLAAFIVSVVWCGFMQAYFDSLPMVGRDLTQQPSEMVSPAVEPAAVESSSAVLSLSAPTSTSSMATSSSVETLSQSVDSIERGEIRLEEQQKSTSESTILFESMRSFMGRNSTRKNMGHMLAELKVDGVGIEIGASHTGSFTDVIMSTWRPKRFYLADPAVNGDIGQLSRFAQSAWRDGNLMLVAEAAISPPQQFEDNFFSFIYINPSRVIDEDLKAWYPKLKTGGVFAGKDYCASMNEKRSPQLQTLLHKTPWCGTYHGGPKNGKEKSGFGKYIVRAVDMFADQIGRYPEFTLEGRLASDASQSDGVANPSWWFVK
mmetsp:Transcript_41567/g.50412  ORF Transcript_41567/g.50412 Transcript_41567/m.50412 type:complete len:334 (+) Transcript_41567:375-1376(+)|eukprot:CAMPEP_0197856062 /NCGR_PEP_ID=MMETSP1438-20131217/27819_1 /TAXON_ID=1461541 /ORGANISM="Pterosperma sp., Strain CCMP1384" /LENGTH=333 /DNA_ID=CAMNT_0043471389 /DNA_START=375 /DNA_END=1376 /DNA_ORIENTATION=-